MANTIQTINVYVGSKKFEWNRDQLRDQLHGEEDVKTTLQSYVERCRKAIGRRGKRAILSIERNCSQTGFEFANDIPAQVAIAYLEECLKLV